MVVQLCAYNKEFAGVESGEKKWQKNYRELYTVTVIPYMRTYSKK